MTLTADDFLGTTPRPAVSGPNAPVQLPQRKPTEPGGLTADDFLGPGPSRAMSQFQTEPDEDPSFFIPAPLIAKISLARDPQAQLQTIAKETGVPIERLGMRDGRPIVRNDEGREFALIPKGFNVKNAARFAGELPATIGGTIGGVTGGIKGAQVGTAIGESSRQLMANQLTGERLTPGESLGEQAFEQGVSLVSEGVGRAVAKGIGVGKTAKVAKSLKGAKLNDANALIAKANKFGIEHLTPGESTQLKSLMALERVLARVPEADDTIQAFLSIRNEQVENAVVRLMDDLSLEGSAETAGRMVRGASQDALEQAQQALIDKAGPIYRKAFRSGQPVDARPALTTLKNLQRRNPSGGKLRSTLNRIEGLMTFKRNGKLQPRSNLQTLHNAKLEIDRILQTSMGDDALSKAQKAQVAKIKDKLMIELKRNGDYAKAVGIYEEGMPAVTNLNDSLISTLADTPTTSLQDVSKRIFNPGLADPKIVTNTRAVIEAQNPQAWEAVVRSHLQREFFAVGDAIAEGAPQGALFRKKIFGSPAKRKMLQAALTPEQFRTMSELMDVLEATGKVFKGGESITAFAQRVFDEMKSGNAVTAIASLMSPLDIGTRIAAHYQQIAQGQFAKHLAEIVTSPGALKQLNHIKQVGPGSTRGLIEFFRLTGGTLIDAAVEGDPDITPGSFAPNAPQMQQRQQNLIQELTR